MDSAPNNPQVSVIVVSAVLERGVQLSLNGEEERTPGSLRESPTWGTGSDI